METLKTIGYCIILFILYCIYFLPVLVIAVVGWIIALTTGVDITKKGTWCAIFIQPLVYVGNKIIDE